MVDKQFYQHRGPLSLAELISGLDVDIPEGQFCDQKITGAAPIDAATPADITYLGGKRAKAQRAKLQDKPCRALACLVTDAMAESVGQHNVLPLHSKNPRADFAKILPLLYRPLPFTRPRSSFEGVLIEATAFVDETAKIGTGTRIEPGAVIGPGVVIGQNCHIGANAVIKFTLMGDNCHIQSGAVLGGDGFGVALTPDRGVEILHLGTVILGDEVMVGCQSCVDRAMFGETRIGSGTKTDNLVQIAHNVKIGKNCLIASQTGISGSVLVGDNVIMAGQVGIADHLEIGDRAILTAQAGLMHNVPPGEVWGGYPAQKIRNFMKQTAILRKMVKGESKTS